MSKKLIGGIAAGVIALAVIAALLISGILGKDSGDNPVIDVNNGQSSSEVTEQEQPTVEQVEDIRDNMTDENVVEAVNKLSDNYTFTEEVKENMMVVGDQYRISKSTVYSGKSNTSDDLVELELSHRINGNPSIAIMISTSTMSEDEVYKLTKEVLADITSEEIIDKIIEAEYDTTVLFDTKTEEDDNSDLLINKMKLGGLEGEPTDYIFGATYSVHSEDLKDEFVYNENDKLAYASIPIFSTCEVPHILNPDMYLGLILHSDGINGSLVSYSFSERENIQNCGLTYSIQTWGGEEITHEFKCVLDTDTKLMNYSANLMTGYYESMDKVMEQAIKVSNAVIGGEYKADKFIELEKTDKFASYSLVDIDNEVTININISYEDAIGYYGNISIY